MTTDDLSKGHYSLLLNCIGCMNNSVQLIGNRKPGAALRRDDWEGDEDHLLSIISMHRP